MYYLKVAENETSKVAASFWFPRRLAVLYPKMLLVLKEEEETQVGVPSAIKKYSS